MHQLPGSDAIFLSMETDSVHAHTGGLTILDPSTADDFSYQSLVAFASARIREIPKFGWKLKEVPFGLDRPYWIEDHAYDPANHIQRIGVPQPGTMRELATLCSDLFSQKLDRTRPLWEMWFIEGVEGGKVAIFQKCHHCLIDGVSGAGLGEVMCDTEPVPPPRVTGPRKRKPRRERVPADAELALRSLPAAFGTPLRTVRYVGQALRRGLVMAQYMRKEDVPMPGMDVPTTPWNDAIGPRRAFACASVSLETVRGIKRALDVKVNDVVLELCAAAMRRYLKAQGELPTEAMVATVPVSTREPGDKSLDNKVGNMTVSLATDIDDPIERLRKIYENTQKSKAMSKAIRAQAIQAMGDTFPPTLLNLAFRTLTLAPTTGFPNATISNVPGPPVPLYTAGARMESMFPMSVLVHGAGLNITVVSYMDRMDFGFTVDPELIPDVWYMAEGITKGLEQLEKALAAQAEAVPEAELPEPGPRD